MRGFAALSLILIISAVMLTVIGTISYTAVGEGQASLALELGEDNLGLVEGCTEALLQNVHDTSGYNSTSFTLDGNTCSVTYTLNGPTNYNATVTVGNTRKINVIFSRGASAITVTSWQEI